MNKLAQWILDCCRDLAKFTEEPGRITRTFLSPPMKQAHAFLGSWMEEIGMRVSLDAAGNLRALYGREDAPRLIIGSHLDTVPNAGAFDGILGVALGIAMAELQPDLALEVIGFSEEEGVRFGVPFIGSKAVTGELDQALLARTDAHGISVTEAIRAFGLNLAELPAARFSPHAIGYFEFHIEQGPVLESLCLPLGVVEAIAGQSRWTVGFTGQANHAGTTPMNLRRDALVSAARWILNVESYAAAVPGLVATVGALTVSPNAGNVIPGEVRASLDVRHPDDAVRLHAVREILAKAPAEAIERLNQSAVRMDEALTTALADAVGPGAHRMTSGAGHDAMNFAPHLPSTMLFLRSPGGISHHPDEAVLLEDVEAALIAGARFIETLGAVHA